MEKCEEGSIMRILLAEDEKALAKAIVKIFEKTTIQPTLSMTGRMHWRISNPEITMLPFSIL